MSGARRSCASSSTQDRIMQSDDDLRARFESLAREEGNAAPPFSRPRGAAPAAVPSWRLGVIIGMAAGAVISMTIGLVLGVSTGYASAEEVLRAHGQPLP